MPISFLLLTEVEGSDVGHSQRRKICLRAERQPSKRGDTLSSSKRLSTVVFNSLRNINQQIYIGSDQPRHEEFSKKVNRSYVNEVLGSVIRILASKF